jgi:hypothetical protein
MWKKMKTANYEKIQLLIMGEFQQKLRKKGKKKRMEKLGGRESGLWWWWWWWWRRRQQCGQAWCKLTPLSKTVHVKSGAWINGTVLWPQTDDTADNP